MISEITNFLESAATDPTISRIAICANGKYFCTGIDLGKKSSPMGQGGPPSDEQYERLTRLFAAIEDAPQVTIACVQGPAFGGGVGLAFACDIRVFTELATMTLSEVRLGLCPATISINIVREWGPSFAREAMLSARPVKASELFRLGLVSHLVEETDALALSDVLDQTLARLRFSSPRGSAMSKKLIQLRTQSNESSSEQARGVKVLFDEMMASSSDAAYGLKRHQAGDKNINWDAFVQARTNVKAHL